MTVIAHVSDPHIDTSRVRRERLERVLAVVAEEHDVRALLVSGDLTDHGTKEEYAEFFATLSLPVPTLVIPGNHDDREHLRPHVPGNASEGPLRAVLDVEDIRLVGLDSTVPGEDGGRLDEATLAFAREAIAGAPGHVLLAMHHPAVPVGHAIIDQYGLGNREDLHALVSGSEKVIGCLAGHVHSALAATFAGVPLVCAPGIASTLRLGSKTDPFADEEAAPGLALHTISPGGALSTRFHYLSPG